MLNSSMKRTTANLGLEATQPCCCVEVIGNLSGCATRLGQADCKDVASECNEMLESYSLAGALMSFSCCSAMSSNSSSHP